MKQFTVATFSLMCVGGLIILSQKPAAGTIYTIAQVRTMIAHNPHAWIGQTLLVRARIVQVSYQLTGSRLMLPANTAGARSILRASSALKRTPTPVLASTPFLRSVWTTMSVSMPCYSASPSCMVPSITGRLPSTPLHLLIAADSSGIGPTLQVRLDSDPAPSFLAFLRPIPLLARFLPPQRISWSGIAVYHLHILRAAPCHTLLSCDDAVLISGL